MSIRRIEELIYGVNNLQEGITFFENWGLKKIESAKTGALFKTAENQKVLLRMMGASNLPPTNEEGPTVREVIWGVDSTEDLDEISADLSIDRDVTLSQDGCFHTLDNSGNSIGFKLSDVIPVDVPATNLNFYEKVGRLNVRGWPEERARPLRIGHVVYSIERDGNWEAAQFYMDRLNFRLSDRSKDGGTFLRCEGSEFHHSLFLFHREGTRRYFNHVGFEVNSFDEIMTGGTYMQKAGAHSVSGPGRHSLGSNLFWYFKNPCGGDIEYFADMDRINDEWEPGYWEEAPPYARWMIGDDILTG